MIKATHLSKSFGKKVAVDNISFMVERGEVLGFLGPNAAGKSTTMRMLTGFLPPTSGTALIGGEDIVEGSLAARRKIGYLPENAPVYPDMTVLGFLDFVAEIRGFSGAEKKRTVGETIERCFLSGVRFQTINTLSKGFKQRVCFAQSILHDPEYLIMDEPTDGLDPNQKHEVRGMIREMAREKTIILSTHILEEVDAVCTRAIIIADGRIVADDTPEGLRARSPVQGAVHFTVHTGEGESLLQELQKIPSIRSLEVLGKTQSELTVRLHPKDIGAPLVNDVSARLGQEGGQVTSLFVEEGRLDDVFRAITASASKKEQE
ncbi:MAG: ATP-binding cassette domain-containing protein [Deltaproteobacteria bacterium]|nr:MAG: ATP-binding cassette domain-containing protein [Deltaproteobacteria bacterium]